MKNLLKKRKNLSKEEVTHKIEQEKKVSHMRDIVRDTFPSISEISTIYDAQTALNAIVGFIDFNIEKKSLEYKISDLNIDLSDQEDSDIKTAMLAILEKFKDETAKELSQVMAALSKQIQGYSSHTFMKQPMETIKIEDILG